MVSFDERELAAAVAVLERVWRSWLTRPEVTWLDVGPQLTAGSPTGKLALRVFVDRKRPPFELGSEEAFPATRGPVPVDVIEAAADDAIAGSAKDLAELPPSAALLALRGDMLTELGRASEAEEAYARAVEIDPQHAGAWYGLGQLRLAAGRLEPAEEALRRAAEHHPYNGEVLAALGIVLVMLGRVDEARAVRAQAADAGAPAERLDELDGLIATHTTEQPAAKMAEQPAAPQPADRAAQQPPAPDDRVFTLPDAPARIDLLGRKPLAESLADRFRTMRDEDPETSFLLHIDGPWGSGKSSLLNYLREDLSRDSLVVDVNAWREQRVGPPWLALLLAFRRAAIGRYGWPLRARELLARVRAVGPGYLAALLVTAGITAALLTWTVTGEFDITSVGDAARSLAAVVALGVTVWTATGGLQRRLLPGSPRGAEQYVETHADPLQKVGGHFNSLLRLVPDPVVVFIDDLDRCTEAYVVEFLEAVQTLLRAAPAPPETDGHKTDRGTHQPAPYFVVAADGRWIRASYERAYASFAGEVTYPGRPLGYLFLEKAFQLTTTLPAIDLDRRQAYLDYLLRIEKADDVLGEHEADRARAEAVLSGAQTDSEIVERLEQHDGEDPAFRFALIGQAVKHMARPEVTRRLEHALRAYAELLEPNPRAMKRFVNAYGVERALRTIEDRHPRADHLARWTIVLLRWPELAGVLRAAPDAVELIGTPVRGAVTDDVRRLFTDPDVVRVVKGIDPRHGEPLDEAAIRDCAGLPAR